VVQKTSRENATSTVLIFLLLYFILWTSWMEKSQSTLKTALKQKKKKRIHTGKQLEAR
jgi:FtsZ-interacting cell division protein ZipA